jgi:ribosomal protein S18 acetylase RimI-like enzyme
VTFNQKGRSLEYSRPTVSEADWIRNCQLKTLSNNYNGKAPPDEIAFVGERFNMALKDRRQYVWLVRNSDAIVGYLWLDANRPPTISLLDLYVASGYRRRGCGFAMLRRTILFARRRHFKIIILAVAASNQAAVGLYEKFGFRTTAEKANHGRRLIRMEMSI